MSKADELVKERNRLAMQLMAESNRDTMIFTVMNLMRICEELNQEWMDNE